MSDLYGNLLGDWLIRQAADREQTEMLAEQDREAHEIAAQQLAVALEGVREGRIVHDLLEWRQDVDLVREGLAEAIVAELSCVADAVRFFAEYPDLPDAGATMELQAVVLEKHATAVRELAGGLRLRAEMDARSTGETLDP